MTNETITKKLTAAQRTDLQAAAAHPEGLYLPVKENRGIAQDLLGRKLLAYGPAVTGETARFLKRQEALVALAAAGQAAMTEDWLEADTQTWIARRAFQALDNNRALHITAAGREAAATGVYQERW